MKTNTIFPNGDQVPRGWCVTPDHYLTKFKLVMVGPKVIERIQSLYKVVKTEGLVVTVQSSKPQIETEVLNAVSQRDAYIIEQCCVVLDRRNPSNR